MYRRHTVMIRVNVVIWQKFDYLSKIFKNPLNT